MVAGLAATLGLAEHQPVLALASQGHQDHSLVSAPFELTLLDGRVRNNIVRSSSS